MKEIPLTQGKGALVDDEDYEWLSKWKWYALKINKDFYAVRKIKRDNKSITFYMHREILGLVKGDGKYCDHKNWITLDNQRNNLRITNKSLNQYNRKMMPNNTSGYRGVSWAKRAQKWETYIGVGGKLLHCGYFSDLILAALSYDQAALKYYGESAILNFPEKEAFCA